MNKLIATLLLALSSLTAAAAPSSPAPGGKACQVAASAVPTPGLAELVMGSKETPVPAEARLSAKQIEALALVDTRLKGVLAEIEARVAGLPRGTAKESNPDLESRPLPELVTHFLAQAVRDQALLIDVESAGEFDMADAAALEAKARGDQKAWCPLCLGVRRGMEAGFAWRAGEFAELSAAQEKEALVLAGLREDVRRDWAAALKAQLTPAQLSALRTAQLRWLKSTLQQAVAGGMRSLGAKKCEACTTRVEWKCEFCFLVIRAVEEAKAGS
ncbi:MAG: hypothetical protein IPK67_10230 [Planctomycetes bacterium]|nr:hypothetical protein [Planctomycetota bacterium]